MRWGGVIVAAAFLASGCESTKIGMYDGETSCTDDGGETLRKCDTGAVAVLDPVSEEDIGLIDRADTRSKASKRGARVRDVSRDNLNARYYDAISAMPDPPKPFTLYFAFGSESDLIDSDATLQALIAEVGRRRNGVDIDIIGHTDTEGAAEGDAGNDVRSMKRAAFVKSLLETRGLPGDVIHISGRGEREPIDNPGVDEFASLKNRRVEVIVK